MLQVHALKEWHVAVRALEQGKTVLLLRKGGIREQGSRFTVAHDRILLYPTYEHQKPHLLKPDYASQVEPVASGYHPEAVLINSWADITHILSVDQGDRLAALLPFHIWTPEFVTERLHWKPKVPLALLLLRVYRLPQPVILPYDESYGGCRSWIDVKRAIALDDSTPVLTDTTYKQQVEAILEIVQA